MRTLTILAGLFVPLAAAAAPISEDKLQANFEGCVQQCGEDAERARCEQGCRCLTDAMARTWDADEFQARTDALQADPGNEQVVAEISRLAEQCE